MFLQDVEDGFAQGDVHAGCHLCGTWRGSSHGSCASHRDGLPVLDRALWLRKSQADPHLQDWPKVSIPPAQSNVHSAGQNPQAHGTEDIVRVALLLWSFPAVFSPLSVYHCYDVILETESAYLITARENFRVHLKWQVFEVSTTVGSGEREALQARFCGAYFLSIWVSQ